MDRRKNYETAVPEGYVLAGHVDARDSKKQAVVYTVLSFVPLVVLVPALCALAYFRDGYDLFANWQRDRGYLVFLAAWLADVAYIPLHELTHGAAYKYMTGGKLSYGFTLNVAFCGVPGLYVRKRVAMTAAAMPFLVFTVVFTALTAGLWRLSPLYGLGAGLVLALHLGGCVGDLHWLLLYLTRFRDCDTLWRDTGPEQWLYIPAEQAARYGIEPLDENT